jgi:hypothetical protein
MVAVSHAIDRGEYGPLRNRARCGPTLKRSEVYRTGGPSQRSRALCAVASGE